MRFRKLLRLNSALSIVPPLAYFIPSITLFLLSEKIQETMEFLSAVLGLLPCLYDHTSKHTVYIRDLEKNHQALREQMEELNKLYRDVKARVDDAEQGQMRRTNEVDGWMREVDEMEKKVAEILQSGQEEIQRRCLRCCPRNCWSSYRIGKRVREVLDAVSDLIRRGRFNEVAQRLPCPRVDELLTPEMVGSESVYNSICGFLKDPQVGIIGLCGTGGVGKTTILKKINNEFLTQSNDFDVVIWAVVSNSPDVEKIQKIIWNKLKIPLDVWETKSNQEMRGAEILRVLKSKRFVLLLDDIWDRLDLQDMGIPLPGAQNQSKIVFSTRSQDVCYKMRAQKRIEVACLDPKAAWTLFTKHVGEETLNSHPHIPRLAKEVVMECRGLPLALVTLGRAMTGKRNPSSWEKVSQDLKISPSAIPGMEIELFHRLKPSYDMLPDNVHKSCFLYCCFFPEDWEISQLHLIGLWMGVGFLGMVDNIHEAWDQGDRIIETLKHACLLEDCGLIERRVRLHDVIRDMSLWLYREYGAKKNKVVFKDGGVMPYEDLKASKLNETDTISLWDINIEGFDEILECPNLKTLIVTNCTKLKRFSNDFFQFMPSLRVLNLVDNANLSELPSGICKLNALTYLNLANTGIKEFPIELKQLKNLSILLVNRMDSLVSIPEGLISSFTSLKLFYMYDTKIPGEIEEILFDELKSLDGLSDIGITISSAVSWKKLKRNQNLLGCMGAVMFCDWGDVTSLKLPSSFLESTRHLTHLAIRGCDKLKGLKITLRDRHSGMTQIAMKEKYFQSLKHVYISNCPKLLDLTWLVYGPFLEDLSIEDCESLQEILRDDGGVSEIEEKLDIFSRLRHLRLDRLPRLQTIYWHPLPLPSLEIIMVWECESLRRLPFDSKTSTKNLRKIEGETSWWNRLVWNDKTVKLTFTRYFEKHEAEASSTDSSEAGACSADGTEEELD